jgi:hypothetical protein
MPNKNDLELIMEIYKGGVGDLPNRRIIDLGVDGMAVVFTDNKKTEGIAVIKKAGINKVANVSKKGQQYFEGCEPVEFRGWVHSRFKTTHLAATNEYWPTTLTSY